MMTTLGKRSHAGDIEGERDDASELSKLELPQLSTTTNNLQKLMTSCIGSLIQQKTQIPATFTQVVNIIKETPPDKIHDNITKKQSVNQYSTEKQEISFDYSEQKPEFGDQLSKTSNFSSKLNKNIVKNATSLQIASRTPFQHLDA